MAFKILCPVDFSPCSRNALQTALGLARSLNAELTIVFAYHVPHYIQPSLLVWMGTGPRPLWQLAEEQAKTELQEFLVAEDVAPDAATVKVVHADPVSAIVSIAERDGHDLVVMGTHGRGAPGRWLLGSVAERCVRSAPCPVLVVPSPRADPTGRADSL
ncbi:MAG: universal stress protein [Polyangiaceae bacterium]|nr:universal stress protein [Polyangiaceae bacterium]